MPSSSSQRQHHNISSSFATGLHHYPSSSSSSTTTSSATSITSTMANPSIPPPHKRQRLDISPYVDSLQSHYTTHRHLLIKCQLRESSSSLGNQFTKRGPINDIISLGSRGGGQHSLRGGDSGFRNNINNSRNSFESNGAENGMGGIGNQYHHGRGASSPFNNRNASGRHHFHGITRGHHIDSNSSGNDNSSSSRTTTTTSDDATIPSQTTTFVPILQQLHTIQNNIFMSLSNLMKILDSTDKFLLPIQENHISILLDILFDGTLDEFSSMLLVNILVLLVERQPDFQFSVLVEKFLTLNFQSECVVLEQNRIRERQMNRLHRELYTISLLNKLITVRRKDFIEYLDVFLSVCSDIFQIQLTDPDDGSSVLCHEILSFVYNLVKLFVQWRNEPQFGERLNIGNSSMTDGTDASLSRSYTRSPFQSSGTDTSGSVPQTTTNTTFAFQPKRATYNLSRSRRNTPQQTFPQSNNSKLSQVRRTLEARSQQSIRMGTSRSSSSHDHSVALQALQEYLLPNIISKCFQLKENYLQKVVLKICHCILKNVPHGSQLALVSITCIHEMLSNPESDLLEFDLQNKRMRTGGNTLTATDLPFVQVSRNMLRRYEWKLLLQSLVSMFQGFEPPSVSAEEQRCMQQTTSNTQQTPFSSFHRPTTQASKTNRNSSTTQHTRIHERLLNSFISLLNSIYTMCSQNGFPFIGSDSSEYSSPLTMQSFKEHFSPHQFDSDEQRMVDDGEEDQTPFNDDSSQQHTADESTFFHIFFKVFGCHDSDMIQVLLYLLQLYTFLFKTNSHILEQIRPYLWQLSFISTKEQSDFFIQEWQHFLNPHRFFFELIRYINFKEEVLLDFLVSSETEFLHYLLKYCKYRASGADEDRMQVQQMDEDPMTNAPSTGDAQQQECIRGMLLRLTTQIRKMIDEDEFPYNAAPLLRCLSAASGI